MKGSTVIRGDVLLNITGASIGRSCVVPECVDEANVNQHVCIIRPKNQVDKKYLQAFLASHKGQKLIYQGQTGSGREGLNFQSIASFKIHFPLLPEQQKIADFLSAVDKKIEQLTEKHRLLTEYKKGVMQQIFSQQIRFKDDEGNGYPEWEEKSLRNIASITMGTSPASSAYNENGIGLPLIQGNADVSNRVSLPRVYTSEITKECFIGDVLLSVRAPVGEVSRSLHHACIGRGMSAIKAAKNNSTEFIYQFLLWFEPRWKSLSQGSTFESVNTKDIKELSVLAPCEEEQQKIADFLIAIDNKIDQAWSKLEQTKTFKKGLLQKMFV